MERGIDFRSADRRPVNSFLSIFTPDCDLIPGQTSDS
ncbi:hypothetical protein wcw_0311 [Waddlia chondrophila WSU 86-1044]|uniref:Uncharacterized protein n=1 Tax=Waddlia chondrophila (strain ATCC VR-1470 / WSU 86-1044) TaxID=716544 RepID=D6YU75_WADCW|nr:hypothetical protein wcw_0311 [Waddlia chondrophila WSU 86-1044]